MDSDWFGRGYLLENYRTTKKSEYLIDFLNTCNMHTKLKVLRPTATLFARQDYYRFKSVLNDDDFQSVYNWIKIESFIGIKILSSIDRMDNNHLRLALYQSIGNDFYDWLYNKGLDARVYSHIKESINDYIEYLNITTNGYLLNSEYSYAYKQLIINIINYLLDNISNDRISPGKNNILTLSINFPLEALAPEDRNEILDGIISIQRKLESLITIKDTNYQYVTPNYSKTKLAYRINKDRFFFSRGKPRDLWMRYTVIDSNGNSITQIPYIELWNLLAKLKNDFGRDINNENELREYILGLK